MKWRLALWAGLLVPTLQAIAAPTNPKISIIGQPNARWTDASASDSPKRVQFDAGETEIVFDDYLNPYASGYFTVALGEEGAELEEGYFTLFRGLPFGLVLKGGKYRAGFGRLNPTHPHADPFNQRFRLLEEFLPGEESFADTGLQLPHRLPSPGESALTIAVDVFQGEAFRIAAPDSADTSEESRPAFLGRVSGFFPLGERSGLELGLSAAHGTNNAVARTRSSLFGADLKLKLWNGPQSYLLVQAEAMGLRRDDARWDGTAYSSEEADPFGCYLFANYAFSPRWNAGLSYERFERAEASGSSDQAFGLFAGLALLEESTVFRAGYERFEPDGEDSENQFSLRVVFSLGPHKAHQF